MQFLILCDDSEETECCEEIDTLYQCLDADSDSSSSSSEKSTKRKETNAQTASHNIYQIDIFAILYIIFAM